MHGRSSFVGTIATVSFGTREESKKDVLICQI